MQSYLLQIWQNVDITIIFITHDLDEAVYLSDRILVLDNHPGRIKEMIEVPVEQPRSVKQHLNPEFLATKAHIENLIHPHRDEEDRLPIIRLTQVNDDIL
jgi:NitT/TauT family transport system ATP-binding protein